MTIGFDIWNSQVQERYVPRKVVKKLEILEFLPKFLRVCRKFLFHVGEDTDHLCDDDWPHEGDMNSWEEHIKMAYIPY